MTRALANAARLTPQIRLAQAVSQFEADLSTEQKANFYQNRDHSSKLPPSISDVMPLRVRLREECLQKMKVGQVVLLSLLL